MGVLKNDVGRPSNKTILIRTILKIVCLIMAVVIGYFVGYQIADKVFDNGSKEQANNAAQQKVTTTTRSNSENKNEDIYKKITDFIEIKKLKTLKNEEAFNMDSLKQDGCKEVIVGRSDEYSLTMYVFDDETSSKKTYNTQKEYQKEPYEFRHNIEILSDKSKDNYDIFEMKRIGEDPEQANSIYYDYAYFVRIDNYYISVFSSSENDNVKDMINIKNDLNSILNIK